MTNSLLTYADIPACPVTVLSRFETRLGCNRKDSLAVWGELLKYLRLRTEMEESLAPSTIVDAMWHEMILHTREYAVLCRVLHGGFIHHEPHETVDASAYERTLDALRCRFGYVNSKYWPSRAGATIEVGASCGGGGGSCS
jgi:hypothetical protein